MTRQRLRTQRQQVTRRHFVAGVSTVVSSCFGVAACGSSGFASSNALLTARPRSRTTTHASGTYALDARAPRSGVVFVPPAAAQAPVPLFILFHGAGGSGSGILNHLRPSLEGVNAVVVAPDSTGRTWDAIRSGHQSVLDVLTGRRSSRGFGPDVAALDRTLMDLFETVAIDSTRIAVAGFSDGATYALSLGLMNGDLFRRVVAFSPGFVIEGEPRGRPEVFVSHGRADDILPIDRSSRRIVPQLERAGYHVTFHEFDGGHEITDSIARKALAWAAR